MCIQYLLLPRLLFVIIRGRKATSQPPASLPPVPSDDEFLEFPPWSCTESPSEAPLSAAPR